MSVRPIRGVLFHADDVADWPLRLTGLDLQRTITLCTDIPIPPRLGPGPWWVTSKPRVNGVAEIIDEYEVTITIRVRKADVA
jgi:hypothetical protein